MSGREWKPGDVAMVEVGCWANRHRAMFTGSGWRYCDGEGWVANDPAIVTARPLVVIDPESTEDVERLRDALWRGGTLEMWQDRLREFANPTPPKPEEPTGDGAVVEDVNGYRWVRIASQGESPDSPPWRHRGHTARYWDSVRAVKVLSEGVQP